MMDAAGREMPSFGHISGYSPRGYAVNEEGTMEHITHAPAPSLVTEYWNISEPGKDKEQFKEYIVDQRRMHPRSAYDWPENVEEFHNNVGTMDDTTRPTKVASYPFSSFWHSRPTSSNQDVTTKDGDDGDFNGKQIYPSSHKNNKKINPTINNVDVSNFQEWHSRRPTSSKVVGQEREMESSEDDSTEQEEDSMDRLNMAMEGAMEHLH